jgi:hypothetical protein
MQRQVSRTRGELMTATMRLRLRVMQTRGVFQTQTRKVFATLTLCGFGLLTARGLLMRSRGGVADANPRPPADGVTCAQGGPGGCAGSNPAG